MGSARERWMAGERGQRGRWKQINYTMKQSPQPRITCKHPLPIHHEYVIWDMQKDLPRLVTNHGNTNRSIISDKKGYQLRLSKETSNIILTFVMKQRSDKRNPMDE
jgi:hypothetical protein